YFSAEVSELHTQLFQADIDYDLLGGTATSTTAWRRTRSGVQWGVDAPNHAQAYFHALWQRYRQFSQEVRFNGTYGPLDITAGGYYQRDTLAIDLVQEFTLAGFGFTGAATTPIGRVPNYDQNSRTLSAFVDTTYRVTD